MLHMERSHAFHTHRSMRVAEGGSKVKSLAALASTILPEALLASFNIAKRQLLSADTICAKLVPIQVTEVRHVEGRSPVTWSPLVGSA